MDKMDKLERMKRYEAQIWEGSDYCYAYCGGPPPGECLVITREVHKVKPEELKRFLKSEPNRIVIGTGSPAVELMKCVFQGLDRELVDPFVRDAGFPKSKYDAMKKQLESREYLEFLEGVLPFVERLMKGARFDRIELHGCSLDEVVEDYKREIEERGKCWVGRFEKD
ncbi:hypothetical protein HOD75_01040 [archaeon]|nr:hypothetical protein [archaeon]